MVMMAMLDFSTIHKSAALPTGKCSVLSQASASVAKAQSVTRDRYPSLSASVGNNIPSADSVSPLSDSPSAHVNCSGPLAANVASCSVTVISTDWGNPAMSGAAKRNAKMTSSSKKLKYREVCRGGAHPLLTSESVRVQPD